MLKQLKKIIYTLGIGLLCGAVFITVDTIIDFGIKLESIHLWLKWGFYLFSTIIALKYLLIPLIKLFLIPKYQTPPQDLDSEEYRKFLYSLRNNFLKSHIFMDNYDKVIYENLKGSDILNALKHADQNSINSLKEVLEKKAIPAIDKVANKLILEKATNVGTLSAISQSGRMDLIIVLVNNIMMVNEIINIYRSRPSIKEIIKLYGLAGSAAFLADQVEDADLGDLTGDALESFGLAKGIVPYASVLMESIFQGIFNAFLTLRVGHAVKCACGAIEYSQIKNARQNGRKMASRELKNVAGSIFRKVGAKGIKGFDKLVHLIKEKIVKLFGIKREKKL